MSPVRRFILLAFILTLCTQDAGASLRTTNGVLPVRWPVDKVPLFVVPHPATAEWLPEIHQAAALYNKVIGVNVFVVLRPILVSPEEYAATDTPPLVILPAGEFATRIGVDEFNGFILNALVAIDPDEVLDHDGKLAVMVHAFGVALGLAEVDTADKPYNIMNRELPLAGGRLLPDDIKALRHAYNPPHEKLMKSTGYIRWTRTTHATDLCDRACLAEQTF